ncbi:hypothetical protein B0H13DRAFT_2371664 [Mycena leptocephala]|nr:hypothetical protein B0H13DRAFT_2371664 [Mycena leptocephala]
MWCFAQIGAQHYFITSNTDYVPAFLPSKYPMRFSSAPTCVTDGRPTLWPQQWTSTTLICPSFHERVARRADVMWWEPIAGDFAVGSTLVARCKELPADSANDVSNGLRLSSLQRAFLELDALYQYMTIYQARMAIHDPRSPETSVANVGRSPLSPPSLSSCGAKLCPYGSRAFGLPDPMHMAPAHLQCYTAAAAPWKNCAIKRAAVHTPWYHDPFETTDTRARSPSPDAATPVASSSRSDVQPRSSVLVASGSPPVARNRPQQSRPKPYSAKPPTLKGPAKTERDEFSALTIPEMPPSIVSMADALAQVDRSVNPYTSNDADKRYVLPEPALLVNTTSERRRKFLHHWNLLSDGFIYMLTQHPQLLRPGMEGRLGGPSDERWKRAICRASRASPCLSSLFLSSALEQTREIVWQRDRLGEVKDCFAGHMLVGSVGDEQAWMGIDNATRAPSLCGTDSNSDAGLDH